ncbi:MAG: hypothetical protein CSA33_02095 [Desulfobulbus propionicus]|nr:MAG: hypothetical protein CSA33_02095 [Desulfobulbus propionicus]
MHIILRLFLPAVCFVLLMAALIGDADARTEKDIYHSIELSFDRTAHLVHATSKIDLPPGTPLHLDCGRLTITGALIEPLGTTPLTIHPDTHNHIHIPPRKEQQHVWVSYALTLPSKGSHDNIVNEDGIILAGFWHPQSRDRMYYSLRARIPTHFSAVAETNAVKTYQEKQEKIVQMESPVALRAMHFAAGPYTVRSLTVGTITLYTYFFSEDDHLAQAYLDKARDYLTLYQRLIGPFPYKRYSIVENILPTGYGLPGFTLLGRQVVRLPFIKDTSLGHEILHSWFGNSLFVDYDHGNWAEGLTSYLADHLYAQQRGQDVAYRKHQILRYNAWVPDDNSLSLRAFRSPSWHQKQAEQIRAVGYNKGTLFFHMLKEEIGEAAFIQAVRTLYNNHIFTMVSWHELEAVFSQAANRDMSAFFSQWLDSKNIPVLELKEATFQQHVSGFVVKFTLSNNPPFALTVPVRITTTQGTTWQQVRLEKEEQTFTLQTDALPLSLTVDPGYDLMRKLTEKETPPLLAHLFASTRLRILVSPSLRDTAQPIVDYFTRRGASLTKSPVSNRELMTGDWIFIGDSKERRSLFGLPQPSPFPIAIEMHKNPLSPGSCVLHIDLGKSDDMRRILRVLPHYQKYSSLGFLQGRIQEKTCKPSVDGIHTRLLAPPMAQPAASILTFEQLIDRLRHARVVYIGETHSQYGHHLLQLQLIQALHTHHPDLAIGLEMFPAATQPALDAYIQGEFPDQATFIEKTAYHDVWGYDYRLYRDIFTYANNHGIPLIGLNTIKRIPSTVFQSGSTDALGDGDTEYLPEARSLILPGYQEGLEPFFQMHSHIQKGSRAGFLQAQAIWDETMAEHITKYLSRHPKSVMIVLAGTGHVNKMNAIPPRVLQRMGQVGQLVVVPDNGSPDLQPEQYDYLVTPVPVSLPPSGKIGLVLKQQHKKGLQVERVSPHGKAKQAGIEKNDIIRRINNMEITTLAMLRYHLMDLKPGDCVEVVLERDGKLYTTTVELTSDVSGRMPPMHP